MADSGYESRSQTSTAYGIPVADGSGDIDTDWLKVGNGSGQVAAGDHQHNVLDWISLGSYIETPSRFGQQNLHGYFAKINDAETLSGAVSFNATGGIGKMVFVINAGADYAGTLTVTGTSVNRDTGATTGADTDDIVIDTLTTDDTDTDGEGNSRWAFTNAYITSKWFSGQVTVSTADLDLSDVDVYIIAFEQFGDNANVTLETFDITAFNAGTTEWLFAYLYSVDVTGSKVDITREASVTQAAPGTANLSYRLRRGNLGVALNGTTDGIFVNMFLGPDPVGDWSSINVKVWATVRQQTDVYS